LNYIGEQKFLLNFSWLSFSILKTVRLWGF